MMDDNENYFEDSEIYSDSNNEDLVQVVTSGNEAHVQAMQEFNLNFSTGVLGIVMCLGFVFGALLGAVYDRIFRK